MSILIHPHKHYRFQCGMNISYNGLKYMFLGYVEKTQCMLADQYGNKFIAFLANINK